MKALRWKLAKWCLAAFPILMPDKEVVRMYRAAMGQMSADLGRHIERLEGKGRT